MANKRKGKCDEQITRKVCILIGQGMSWTKIAEVVSISKRAMEIWKDESSEYYEPEFAEAVKEAQEKLACEGIKANQKIEANKHVLKKTTRILRAIDVRSKDSATKRDPPVMPPREFRKREIIAYADKFLDLELDPAFTINEMRMECQARIAELTIEVMIKIKEEPQEVAANPQAVKNVLTNCGPEDKRWRFDQQHVIDTADPLTKLLGEIAAVKAPLPGEEEHE